MFRPEVSELDEELELLCLEKRVVSNRSEIKKSDFSDLNLPCYIVEENWFDLGGKRQSGAWHCYQAEGNQKTLVAQHAIRICSHLYNKDAGQ